MITPDYRTRPYRSAVLLLLVALAAGCAGLHAYREPPRVSLVSIQPGEMNVLEQRYQLQLRIMNPNDEALPVAGMQYALQINGREFAYGLSRQPVSIPAYGEAVLDVDLVSNLLGMLQQLQEMSVETHESLKYRLKGSIRLDNSHRKLPFDYSGELHYLPAGSTAE